MDSSNENKFDPSLIQSSAKKEDFTGLSEKQIIEKYEKLLVEREKEVREISYQMGVVNEKYFDGLEKIKTLQKENEELENKINKINKLINNEINSKKIMNDKISELTKKNIELRNQRNNLTGNNDPLLTLAQNKKKIIQKKMKEEKNNNNFKGLASEEIKYQPLFE